MADRADLASTAVEFELERVLFAATGNERERRVLRRRLGWSGGPPASLAAAGREIDVTRERARQIELGFRARVADAQTPVLDRALEVARHAQPASDDEVEETLRSAGLIRADFSLDALRHAARVFGRDPIDVAAPSVDPPAALIRKSA